MYVTDFDSEKKHIENYTVIGHDLQGFTVKKYWRRVNGGKRPWSYFIEVGLLRK